MSLRLQKMPLDQAQRRIFGYAKVASAPVIENDGAALIERLPEPKTVGLTFDAVTNRVYEVTEFEVVEAKLRPVRDINDAIHQFHNAAESEILALDVTDFYGRDLFNPFREVS